MKKLLFVIGILFSAIALKAQCSSVSAYGSLEVTLEANGEFLFTSDLGLIGDYSSCTVQVGLLDTLTGQHIIPFGSDMVLDCAHVGVHHLITHVEGFGTIIAFITILEGVNGCQVNVPADTYAMNFTKRNFGGYLGTDGTLNGSPITQYYDWLWFLPEADLVSGENTINFPASNNQVPLSGISTLDIVFGQRMIADVVEYPLRAVLLDVDDSGYLGVNDLLLMRDLILGVSSSLPVSNYLFISKTYAFPSDFDAYDFTDLNFREYKFDDATVTAEDLNFNVYMMGNINEVTDSLVGGLEVSSRSNEELVLENREVLTGEIITVPLKVTSDINIKGIQFSLALNGLSLIGVSHNYSAAQFGYNEVSSEDLRFLLNDVDGLDELELILELESTEDGSLEDMISLSSGMEAFLADVNQKANLDLVFRTTSNTEEVLEINTSLLSTQILIDLPIGHTKAVNIYSLDGRLVQQYKVDQNQVIINRSDLKNSGMYFISTQIKDRVVTKKIVAL